MLTMAGLAAIAASVLASPARADAIDGDWCADDGRNFAIRGPAITTPGGAAIEGEYARHGFAYVVPQGEAGAGERVAMTLLNENTVEIHAGDHGLAVIWIRCKPAIS
jgi:hypothetical protein